MSEIEYQKARLKRKHQMQEKNKKPTTNPISKLFTKVLIATILVLMSSIYVKLSDENLKLFQKNVLETNLSFTKFNEWYEKYFGNVLPIDLENKTMTASVQTNEFSEVTKYKNGVSCKINSGSIISTLNSGILVFLGEKEDYGNVAIIQGIDGVDIWYGNIENVNLSLYDYVEKGALLGSAHSEEIYLIFQKDGQYLEYEEYKNQI